MGTTLIFAIALSDVASKLGVIFQVAIGLGLVIFVHELGHFLAAKMCGVKCEKFYIGFDVPIRIGPIRLPSRLGRFRWGETEYGIGVIPLGGYVKMLGQDDNPGNAASESERIRVPTENGGDRSYALDPRSFPAKSVWQRMIIIMAGVTMNLIFAVVFGTIAYRLGVDILPCNLGGTAPGEPAWVKGIEPGDKIVQLGRNRDRNENLRFRHDLSSYVMLNGWARTPGEIELLVHRNGKDHWTRVKPSNRREVPTLGVIPVRTTEVGLAPEGSTPEDKSAIQEGDRIVAVDGVPLPRDAETGQPFWHHAQAMLDSKFDQSVKLTIERTPKANAGQREKVGPETIELTLPPLRAKTIGLVMEMGPIEAIRENSLAEKAGFRVGEIIIAVNGRPVEDPLLLPQQLARLEGDVEFTLREANDVSDASSPGDQATAGGASATRTVSVEFQGPPRFADGMTGDRLTLENVGIAFSVSPVVAAIEPGSPAERAGVPTGARLVKGRVVATSSEAKAEARKKLGKNFDKEREIDAVFNWLYFQRLLPVLPSHVELELTWKDGDKLQSARLVPEESPALFDPGRGLLLKELHRKHQAATLREAAFLGVRETREKLLEVYKVLSLLVSRPSQVLGGIGGPAAIATIAGDEASQSTANLLLFLTLISANLALVNMLPIPALDGGHMMFLLYEAVRNRPVNEQLQVKLTLAGIACLLALMVFAFSNDIRMLFF